MWALTVQPDFRPRTMAAFAEQLLLEPEPEPLPEPKPEPKPEPEPTPGPVGYQLKSDNRSSASRLATLWQAEKPLCIAIIAGALVLGILLCAVLGIAYARSQRKAKQIVTTQTTETTETVAETSEVDDPAEETLAVVEPLEGTTEEGLAYEIQDGEAVITGYTGDGGDLIIPSEIHGYPVTKIAANVFSFRTSLTGVAIPSTCENICTYAFRGCENLASVQVTGDGGAEIWSDAFYDCTGLTCVPLGPNVHLVDSDEFSCTVYRQGQDLGGGYELERLYADDDGVLYGLTAEDEAVLLEIPAALDELEMPETVQDCQVVYLGDDAFSRLDGNQDEFCLYLSRNVTWSTNMSYLFFISWDYDIDIEVYCPGGSLTYDWVLSWELGYALLDIYEELYEEDELVLVEANQELIEAAMIRAEELETLYSFDRPDGGSTEDLLESMDAYAYANELQGRLEVGDALADEYSDEWFSSDMYEIIEDAVELCTDEETLEEGIYFDQVGVARYYSDGWLYVYVLAAVTA